MIVKAIAENGDEQDYTIMVKKYSKIEELVMILPAVIILIGTLGIIGYLTYYFTKK